MKESQLKLGNQIQQDRKIVYDQMQRMKRLIGECGREQFETENPKESFDTFKADLLKQCDQWVEDQRKELDDRFKKL